MSTDFDYIVYVDIDNHTLRRQKMNREFGSTLYALYVEISHLLTNTGLCVYV